MNIEQILKNNCSIINSGCDVPLDKMYVSKLDNSYLTFVGMEDELSYLEKRNITEQLQSIPKGKTVCIGFSPKENKWYGWSHRAIYGFTIGSEVKIGDCGFSASNAEEFYKQESAFWYDEDKKQTMKLDEENKCIIISDETSGGMTKKIDFPKKWGKGEWTAKTLEDAKQMAIDFAKEVS